MALITVNNAKTMKGEKLGYLTGVLYMAPARIEGPNVCPSSSAGCRAACLYSAGRGKFSNVQRARIARKELFFKDREGFLKQCFEEIARLEARATRQGLRACVRLNGTSDIAWERQGVRIGGRFGSLMDHFPHLQFYDYSKRPIENRINKIPPNYDLTFSRAEDNEAQALAALQGYGIRVAAVFEDIPETYQGVPVFNGDLHDLRFLDPQGVWIGLNAKGDAKGDASGFVIRNS